MKFSRLFFLFWFWNSTYHLCSQAITKQDSIRIETLYQLAKDSIYENPDKSIRIANQILELSTKKNYHRGIVKANFLLGLSCYGNADYRQALLFYQKAIAVARKENYQEGLCMVLNSISGVYVLLSDYEKALASCYESLDIRLKKNDTVGVAKCYYQLSDCFFRKKDLEKALFYIDKAIHLLERLAILKNYSDALRLKGLILIEEKKYTLALQNFEKSKKMADSLGDGMRLLAIYSDIASSYQQMKDFDRAKSVYRNLLQMPELKYDVSTHLIVLNNIGSLYLEDNNPTLSEKYLLEGLSIAKEVNSYDYLQLVYSNLSELFFMKGDYKKAYYFKEQFLAYSDSVMNNEKMRAVEELSVKFETREIAEQNKLLQIENKLDKAEVKQKNLILLIVALFFICALLFVLFFIRRNKEKNRHKNNELKQKLLLTQMNPHFIFNSVDNIQSLIHNKQDKEAISYLTKFSKLTRQILENSTEDYITLSEELAMTDNYLNIQQLLYNNKFTYAVTVDEAIDPESILLPPMLTQPFIENAIKHGLKHKLTGGVIAVKFYMKELALFFEVTDNGSGLETEKNNSEHKSLSTQIVTERLKNNATKRAIVITTQNIIENNTIKGVNTKFEIPYIYDN